MTRREKWYAITYATGGKGDAGSVKATSKREAVHKAAMQWGGRSRDYRAWEEEPVENPMRRKNPTKAQRAVARQKASVKRRVAVALAKYLKQQNPAVKLAGAKVEKLKGGVLKITPIKMNSNAALPYKVLFYGKTGYEQPRIRFYKTWASARAAARKHRAKGLVAVAEAA